MFRSVLIKTVNLRYYSDCNVRVRFAPSPTGYLHLGGLRTALYNYFFARANNGRFILRIEDTDQTRLVSGAVQQLQDDLEWAGIEIDEGPKSDTRYGPYIQSKRLDFYRKHVQTLLDSGAAYYCFCTDKRLDLLRRDALRNRQVPKYDNRCRFLTVEQIQDRLQNNQDYCIRFKLSPGLDTFNDLIYGDITYDVTTNEGDPIIIKSDGYPTYHFANIVDDHCMEISHVLRGVEWQISTTKHLQMYKAFNWTPPRYGHLPLLMNSDGTKLSKRQGDITINYYRNNGIFPLALVNYIVNCGGGFEKDLERFAKPKSFTLPELIEQFDISRINSNSTKLMPERLLEFNRLELKRKLQNSDDANELIESVRIMVEDRLKLDGDSLEITPEHIRYILNWSVNRISKLSDLVSNDLKFIWICPKCTNLDEKTVQHLTNFYNLLNNYHDFQRDNLNRLFRSFCKQYGIKFGDFMKTLRSVLSGLKEGPSVAEMMEILGKDTTLRRLTLNINKLLQK